MILESNKMVFLRNADESDIDNLYHWRNDIETRNNSAYAIFDGSIKQRKDKHDPDSAEVA